MRIKTEHNKELKRILIVSVCILIILGAYLLYHFREIERQSKYFTSDNRLIVEDKPFFPIGIYSVDPTSAFAEIKETGFNCVHTYECDHDYIKAYINGAEHLGLRALLFTGARIKIGRDKISGYMNNVEKAVEDFEDSSAVLAWYLCDEPDGQKISPKQLKKEKDSVYELDSIHPTAVVVANPQEFDNYADATDILMVDPYPVPRQPLVMVGQTVDLARKAVGDKKLVWAVLQAFGYQNENNKGWGWEREPTFEEMRVMTYVAIAGGVRGIFYYTYHGSQYYIKDSSQHWENLKAIVRELNAIYPFLAASEIQDVEISISEVGNEQTSLYWTARKVTEGNSLIQPGTYLLAVNGAKCPGAATFVIDGRNIGNVKVILEQRDLKCNGGQLTDHFEPYEVHIYSLG